MIPSLQSLTGKIFYKKGEISYNYLHAAAAALLTLLAIKSEYFP